MCQTFRNSYERVLGVWAKWMEQTGIKQTMWESWVGRTQPEKPWQGLELNLFLRICTFLVLCNFNFRRENIGCVVSIRSDWRKGKKTERGHHGKQSKMFDIDLFLFFLRDEIRQLVYAVLAVSWTAFLSTPFALDSVQISSIWFHILIDQPPPDIKVGFKRKDAWQRPTQPELGAI